MIIAISSFSFTLSSKSGKFESPSTVNTDAKKSFKSSALSLSSVTDQGNIDNIKIGDKLGASDHVSIVLMYCVNLKEMNPNNKGMIFIRQTTDQFANIYKMFSGMRVLGISL